MDLLQWIFRSRGASAALALCIGLALGGCHSGEKPAEAPQPASANAAACNWTNQTDHHVMIKVSDGLHPPFYRWGDPQRTVGLMLERGFAYDVVVTYYTPHIDDLNVPDMDEQERKLRLQFAQRDRERGRYPGEFVREERLQLAWDVKSACFVERPAAGPAVAANTRQKSVVCLLPLEGEADPIAQQRWSRIVDTQRFELASAEPLLTQLRQQYATRARAIASADDALASPGEAARLAYIHHVDDLVIGRAESVEGERLLSAIRVDCRHGQIVRRASAWVRDPAQLDAAVADLAAQLDLRSGGGSAGAPRGGQEIMDAINLARTFNLSVRTADGRLGYTDGQFIRFIVESDRDCYLTLIARDTDGKTTLLLPNRWRPVAQLKAHQPLMVPWEGAEFTFPVEAPHGKTLIRAYASDTPLHLTDVSADQIMAQGMAPLSSQTRAVGIRPASGNTQAGAESEATPEWSTADLLITTRGSR